MVEGEQACDEDTGEYDGGKIFLHGLARKFRKPLIRGGDEGRGLVVFGGCEHEPKDDHWCEEATVRPREEVEGGQHEFKEVSGDEDRPMGWGLDAFEHEQEGQCEEDAMMVPDDGRAKGHENEQGGDGIEQVIFF